MRALFIGGTGIISSACAELAVARGIEVTVLNRGATSLRPVPTGVGVLRADINDRAEVARVLDSAGWDVVVDFLCFTPDQADARVELFAGRTGQYIFISSASTYQKPPLRVPILESTPLRNPYWQYSRDKIACEDLFVGAYRDQGFPVAIVRPSHTYDHASLPFEGGWTVVERMRQGREVIVHGDGSSLWTLTHNTDFAKGFVPLLGNPQVIGDSFHITSQEALSWDDIHRTVASAAGTEARIVHVPSDAIAARDAEWGASLLGDKAHTAVFNNDKIRSVATDFVCTVPFARGAEEIIAWFDADPSRRRIDEAKDGLMDALARDFRIRTDVEPADTVTST